MRRKPRRKGDRLTDCGRGRVAAVKRVGRVIGSFFLLPVVNPRIANLKKERSYREETPRPDSDSV
jgi:hypothetical protein